MRIATVSIMGVLAMLAGTGATCDNSTGSPQGNPGNSGSTTAMHDMTQRTEPLQPADGQAEATFAAGCFWHVEDVFQHTEGVVATEVGYSGGDMPDPTYKQVCSNDTGHAEAVHVIYDPERISYEELLAVFWGLHDPTQVNRQGPDFGSQYRSAIFYYTPEQERAAWASKKALGASGKYSRPIATQIVPAEKLYPAEEYHQKYVRKHGG